MNKIELSDLVLLINDNPIIFLTQLQYNSTVNKVHDFVPNF